MWFVRQTCALVILTAAGSAGCSERPEASVDERAAAPIIIGAEDYATVRRAELARGPMLSGRLTAERDAEVRAELSGSVVQVLAEPGQSVKKGAVIARIDAAALRDQLLSARTAVSSAQTTLALAQREVERMRSLAEAGAVSEQQVEQARRAVTAAEAQVADAQARVALATEQISKSAIVAPIAGVVAERPVNAGDVVQPGAPLFRIIDPTSMRLEGTIPANELREVHVGDPVQFEITGYPDRTFHGRVSRVIPAVNPSTGQVQVVVTLPNPEGELVAGLFARGRVASQTASGLIVPVTALIETEGATRITVVRDSRVQHLDVRVVLRDPLTDQAVIEGPLTTGENVLLGLTAKGLVEGTRVQLTGSAPLQSKPE